MHNSENLWARYVSLMLFRLFIFHISSSTLLNHYVSIQNQNISVILLWFNLKCVAK